MKKDFIYTHIRKISLFSCLISVIPLIIVILLAVNIPFREVFYPVDLSYPNSASTVYDSGKEYVEITLNNVQYTGYDVMKKGKVYGSYYYSLVNNSCTYILIKSDNLKKDIPDTLENYTIKAKLVESNKYTKAMIKSLSKDINWTNSGLTNVSSNIVIDETQYNSDIFVYLAICFSIISLMLISFIIINIVYCIFPGFFPACINFRRLTKNRKEVSHVNFELTGRVVFKSGNIQLTEHYLVATSMFNIEIIPLNSIIWAYEHSTWHKLLWYKIKLTYTLHLYCKKGIYVYSPRNTKEDIDAVINYLTDNYPDIIYGYSKENKAKAHHKLKKI